MLLLLFRTISFVTINALIVTGLVWSQQTQESPWKDRAEYDLYMSITKAESPQKKLELLNTWKEKYPDTKLKLERLQLYLGVYQALNQTENVMTTAKQMLAIDPKNIAAMYSISLVAPYVPNPTQDTFETTEKAANGLLANLDTTFAADKRPQTTNEAEWKRARTDMSAVAYKALGWVSMQRKNNERAEEDLKKSLEQNPDDGYVAYWLGTVMLAEKKPEKNSAALYYFARAAAYEDKGALPTQARQQVRSYLEKTYKSYHGSTDGLDQLLATAKARPTPPPDFNVKTGAQVAFEKEEQFRQEHPMLALWQSVKEQLEGPNGEEYFESKIKRALMPGDAVPGVTKFRGHLISEKPAKNPKELVLGISNPNTPEVKLSLDQPLRGSAPPGTEISFEGVATEFQKQPFTLTFEVETKNIEGWPAPAPPAGRRRR